MVTEDPSSEEIKRVPSFLFQTPFEEEKQISITKNKRGGSRNLPSSPVSRLLSPLFSVNLVTPGSWLNAKELTA
ncbi:hypothetical protein AVEN_27462-1 [Araneus ventricosus]|uniref:Uncharacterized protein n=1 Tax=Araneus ventricosus TaxID=182803 RepID=A0A4Y2K7U0_ARAVE|nr:hypothetical protein AVEN_27462-1 [Araneus ventricosus]